MKNFEAIAKLPGCIKVRVIEDSMGNVLLRPISKRIRELVRTTNEYNHSCEVYMQLSSDIESFLNDYPSACYDGQVNDGCVILIESWTYRHMVGGQSD